MKKKIFLYSSCSLWLLFSCYTNTMAIEFKMLTSNEFLIPPEETISNELWLAAPSITIDGLARDDLFLFAGLDDSSAVIPQKTNTSGNINITGYCTKDLWALANKINITGKIEEHTRIAAKDITLQGNFGKSVVSIASTLASGSNAVFNEDAILLGNYVIADGYFKKNVKIIAQQITLSGVFMGDLEIVAKDVTVLPSAQFRGRLSYDAPSEIVLSDSQRSTMPSPPIRITEQEVKDKKTSSNQKQFWQLIMFLGALPCAWLLIRIFPQIAQNSMLALRNSFWQSMLVGLIIIAAFPVIAAFSIASVIGIPLLIVVSAIISIMAYAGKFVVAGFSVSMFAQKSKILKLLSFALVLFMVYGLSAIPILGTIFTIILFILGIGTITFSMFMQKNKDAQ